MTMVWRLLLAGAAGALCYLDRTAAFQIMVHRPLVAASLAGAVFGDLFAGALVGSALELLYIARLPVGAQVPPDDTGAALFAGSAAACAASPAGLDTGTAAAIVLLSAACAEAGRIADRAVRRANGRIAHLAMESVERGEIQAVEHGLLAGLLLFGLSGFLLAVCFCGLGAAAARYLLPLAGAAGRGQAAALWPLILLLGAASVLSCSREERRAPVFFIAMAVAFGVGSAAWWGR